MYKNSNKPWQVYRNGILLADFPTEQEAHDYAQICVIPANGTITVKYVGGSK